MSQASILLSALILPTQEQFSQANANPELFVLSPNLEADGLVKYGLGLGLGLAWAQPTNTCCSPLFKAPACALAGFGSGMSTSLSGCVWPGTEEGAAVSVCRLSPREGHISPGHPLAN